jgi:Zn-dependent protease with chaperone function
VALIVALFVATLLWRGATTVLLRSLGTGGADEDDDPRVFNLVEGLCATMGLAFPDLQLLDDPVPDALALGLRPDRAVLVLTTGLLDSLDPVELEGVLAHELTHIKRGDTAPATIAAAALLPVARIVPGASGLVHRWAGPGREFETDRLAVGVTRYPPGLRQALSTMNAAMGEASASTGVPDARGLARRPAVQLTRWLWTVAPGAEPTAPAGELDAPMVRIAALDEW